MYILAILGLANARREEEGAIAFWLTSHCTFWPLNTSASNSRVTPSLLQPTVTTDLQEEEGGGESDGLGAHEA